MCIEENDKDEVEETVHRIVEEIEPMIKAVEELAYTTYKPMVEDICSRNASEAEVEKFLDYMVGHCGSERMLKLFKRVCRRYYFQYPEVIAFEVYAYKDMFEDIEEQE